MHDGNGCSLGSAADLSHLVEGLDAVAVHHQRRVLSNDVALELAVHRVVLKHIRHILSIDEGVIDCHQLHVVALGYNAALQVLEESKPAGAMLLC